jgi:2-amino-4-hydroxy-6-hydroxymethyldihydropteridine diphosphokinase
LKSLKRIYIALGSNIGDRLGNLQLAINKIFERIGNVENVSNVYQTPAWGFEGSHFYNACILVSSRLCPESILKHLLEIEIEMGRIRNDNTGYQNRSIDLDILFYEKEIINLTNLVIPHPELSKRDFVLYPLHDIAKGLIHPVFNKTINELKSELISDSKIKLIDHKLYNKIIEIPDFNYLCIEGNIGAGKTTFTQMLAEDLNAKLILERFKDNPFLPKFYEDPKRYAFPTEMAFLADRHQQLVDDISQLDLFSHFSIADYDLYKSLIFAKVTLQDQEFELYKKVFNIIYRELPKPDLYVYFYQNTDRLLENIRKRGRDYEQNIKTEYLDKINQGYLDFMKAESRFPTKIVDVSDLDFVENRSDYLKLVENIFK